MGFHRHLLIIHELFYIYNILYKEYNIGKAFSSLPSTTDPLYLWDTEISTNIVTI